MIKMKVKRLTIKKYTQICGKIEKWNELFFNGDAFILRSNLVDSLIHFHILDNNTQECNQLQNLNQETYKH